MAAPRNSAHPEVFVCYASHDRERVMTVVRSLQSHEVSLWLDQHRISGGMSWAQQIVQAIRSCKVLLLMCSNAAMRSRAVAQEIQMAWKYQLSYLPLFLERTSFPEQVEFFLEGCQWIEVLDRPVERWLTDILGALQNAGVFCSKPVHQGSSEKSFIRPRCPSAGVEGLWAMAKFTDRIWPLVVERRSSTPQSIAYEVRACGSSQPEVRHKIRLGSSVFWAIEWEFPAHLLLLNHDSEGKMYCLCPSWFAPSTRLRPGVTLFPPEEANCEPFVLTGIPGRESVLAVITDEPLALRWMPPDPSVPARVLDQHDLLELEGILGSLGLDHWSALATDIEVVGLIA